MCAGGGRAPAADRTSYLLKRSTSEEIDRKAWESEAGLVEKMKVP